MLAASEVCKWRTVVLEFGDEFHSRADSYNLREISILLCNKIQDIIDNYIKELAKREKIALHTLLIEEQYRTIVPNLEVVVGDTLGDLKQKGKRYGEIYSMRWQTSNVQIDALRIQNILQNF